MKGYSGVSARAYFGEEAISSLRASLTVLILIVFSAMLCVPFATAAADGFNNRGSVAPTPKGFKKYLVFLGDGRWRSADGSIMVGGLKPGNGMFFQREIMKRTDAEIDQNRNAAIAFFKQRFGIDVLSGSSDFLFTDVQVDPQNHMRAYTISGESVPAGGWEVRDGGWGVFIMNPNGITLGGEFQGVHLPGNSAVFFGDYNIKVEKPNGEIQEIIIHYDSDLPFVFDDFGAGPIRCQLFSDKYGQGEAGGHVSPTFLDNNFLMQQNIRNVLTFPDDQDK